jgi:hypothetical protein
MASPEKVEKNWLPSTRTQPLMGMWEQSVMQGNVGVLVCCGCDRDASEGVLPESRAGVNAGDTAHHFVVSDCCSAGDVAVSSRTARQQERCASTPGYGVLSSLGEIGAGEFGVRSVFDSVDLAASNREQRVVPVVVDTTVPVSGMGLRPETHPVALSGWHQRLGPDIPPLMILTTPLSLPVHR